MQFEKSVGEYTSSRKFKKASSMAVCPFRFRTGSPKINIPQFKKIKQHEAIGGEILLITSINIFMSPTFSKLDICPEY